eukprot:EG_transcript_95
MPVTPGSPPLGQASPGPPSARSESPISPLQRRMLSGFQQSPRETSLTSPGLTPAHRADSAVFRSIVERGGRLGSRFPVIDGLYALKAESASAEPLESSSHTSCFMSPRTIDDEDVPMTPRSEVALTPRTAPDLDASSRDLQLEDDVLSHSTTLLEESVLLLDGGRLKVNVAVRVRPFTRRERAAKQASCLTVEGNHIMITADVPRHAPTTGKRFRFNTVFWPAEVPCADPRPPATQQAVFEVVASPLLSEVVRGYNAALLCYGQTGTGKTYTMNGTAADPGIIPRCAEALFDQLLVQRRASRLGVHRVQLSYMEIYKEAVYDLLQGDAGSPRRRPSPGMLVGSPPQCDTPRVGRRSSTLSASGDAVSSRSSQSRGLRVRHHPVRGIYVEGLAQRPVRSGADVLRLWKQGDDVRASAATHLNDRSSRSHTLMIIEVSQQALVSQPGEKDVFSSKVSRLCLADLGGTERAPAGRLQDPARFQEMTATNLSLSTLSRVIELLSDPGAYGTDPLPPYRDSTLTSLLADAFGGNCKTNLIATVSPAVGNLPETVATLRYAARMRRIVNRPVVNEDPSTALISALQQETQVLRQQLQQITASPSQATAAAPTEAEDLGRLRCKLEFSERLIAELRERESEEQRRWETKDEDASQAALEESQGGLERQLTEAQDEIRRVAAEASALQRGLADREADVADLAAEQVRLRALLEAKERQVEALRRDVQTVRAVPRDPSQTPTDPGTDWASMSTSRSPLSPHRPPTLVHAATQTDAGVSSAVDAGGGDDSISPAICVTDDVVLVPTVSPTTESPGKPGQPNLVASLARQLAAALAKLQDAEKRWARERAELLGRLRQGTPSSQMEATVPQPGNPVCSADLEAERLVTISPEKRTPPERSRTVAEARPEGEDGAGGAVAPASWMGPRPSPLSPPRPGPGHSNCPAASAPGLRPIAREEVREAAAGAVEGSPTFPTASGAVDGSSTAVVGTTSSEAQLAAVLSPSCLTSGCGAELPDASVSASPEGIAAPPGMEAPALVGPALSRGEGAAETNSTPVPTPLTSALAQPLSAQEPPLNRQPQSEDESPVPHGAAVGTSQSSCVTLGSMFARPDLPAPPEKRTPGGEAQFTTTVRRPTNDCGDVAVGSREALGLAAPAAPTAPHSLTVPVHAPIGIPSEALMVPQLSGMQPSAADVAVLTKPAGEEEARSGIAQPQQRPPPRAPPAATAEADPVAVVPSDGAATAGCLPSGQHAGQAQVLLEISVAEATGAAGNGYSPSPSGALDAGATGSPTLPPPLPLPPLQVRRRVGEQLMVESARSHVGREPAPLPPPPPEEQLAPSPTTGLSTALTATVLSHDEPLSAHKLTNGEVPGPITAVDVPFSDGRIGFTGMSRLLDAGVGVGAAPPAALPFGAAGAEGEAMPGAGPPPYPGTPPPDGKTCAAVDQPSVAKKSSPPSPTRSVTLAVAVEGPKASADHAARPGIRTVPTAAPTEPGPVTIQTTLAPTLAVPSSVPMLMVTEARAGDDCDGGTAPQMAADWDYNDARRTWQRRLWEMERQMDEMRASYQHRLQAMEVLLEEEKAEAWRKVQAVERRLEAAVARHFDAVAEVEERVARERTNHQQQLWRLEAELRQRSASSPDAWGLPPPPAHRDHSPARHSVLAIEGPARPAVVIPALPLRESIPGLLSPDRRQSCPPFVAPGGKPSARTGAGQDGVSPACGTLETILTQLDHATARTWHGSDVGSAERQHAHHLVARPALAEEEDVVDTKLMQAVVAEYSMLLQSALQDRPEWKEFFDGLLLTIRTVSGKPQMSWLSWFTSGPTTAEELATALRRQEALNVRAAAWLAGLQAQREVMRHTIAAQIRINTRLAKERTAHETEAADLRGRLERACAVLKRLHRERDVQLCSPSTRSCPTCRGD